MKRTLVDNLLLTANRIAGVARGGTSRLVNSSRPTHNNIILFESFYGSRIGGGPLAVYDYLRQAYPERFIYVWAVETPEAYREIADRSDTIVCQYKSDLHLMYSCTAKVLVFNTIQDGSLPTRKGQVQINTWHGGGCYREGASAAGLHKPCFPYS